MITCIWVNRYNRGVHTCSENMYVDIQCRVDSSQCQTEIYFMQIPKLKMNKPWYFETFSNYFTLFLIYIALIQLFPVFYFSHKLHDAYLAFCGMYQILILIMIIHLY